MNILFISTEMSGMISTGGLGEVVTALSNALINSGHDVRIAIPYYRFLKRKKSIFESTKQEWKGELNIGALPKTTVYKTVFNNKKQKIPVYLIEGHKRYTEVNKENQLYSQESNTEPYFFFSAAVLKFLSENIEKWCPDIIHCHDYHSGLLPVYLNTLFQGRIGSQRIGTVFTIHNLGFQGITSKNMLEYGGLPKKLGEYAPDLSSMEFYGNINLLKGALCYADMITTVSKTYAREIQTKEHGKGLEGILTVLHSQGELCGIVNGIDNEIWNPENLGDSLAFSSENIKNKENCKKVLQKQLGLKVCSDPIIAVRSRWSYQKGMELILNAFSQYQLHKYVQFVIIASQQHSDTGYIGYWYELRGWASAFPKRIAFKIKKFRKSQIQNAGSDMFLMPSLYEPCGLAHMEAMRYGTIPIVRKTGGLADTVTKNEGFIFNWNFHEPLDRKQILSGTRLMVKTIETALEKFRSKTEWQQLIRNAMTRNNDWSVRVSEYEVIYQKVIQKVKS